MDEYNTLLKIFNNFMSGLSQKMDKTNQLLQELSGKFEKLAEISSVPTDLLKETSEVLTQVKQELHEFNAL